MSISKTLPAPLFGILILLLIISACAPIPAPSGPRSEILPSPPLSEPAPAELLAGSVPAGPLAQAEPLPSPEEDQLSPPVDPAAEEAGEELTAAEPEATADQELLELTALEDFEEPGAIDLEGQYDFPVIRNKQVEYYLDFFQNRQPKIFARWLARSGRYVPMIREELQKAGLPLDLAYLPMIESGFSLTAFSRAKAVGPWQFMSPTALQYGLRINDYVDERRDPIKSTRAAVEYLSRLHAEFNNWLLAVAGYNAGEGKIRRATAEAGTTNFWKLGPHLHLETKRYVPKLMAAIIIAKNPEKYGFGEVAYENPLEFDTVEVPRRTPLQAVAIAGGQEMEIIKELNRELRQAIAPPQQARYSLKVPKGTAALISQNLPRIQPVVSTKFKTHIVKKRETLRQISRRYKLNKKTLLKANNLRSADLSAGQRLRISYQTTSYVLVSEDRLAGRKPGAVSDDNLVLHTVKRGETLSKIADTYGIPARFLVTWNNLENSNRIRAGQQLALYLEKEDSPAETPAERVIEAKTYKLASASAGRKSPGGKSAPPASTYYHVQGGDTLWKIARRYNVSTDQIKRWNNLKDDVIQPGSQLLLKTAGDIDA